MALILHYEPLTVGSGWYAFPTGDVLLGTVSYQRGFQNGADPKDCLEGPGYLRFQLNNSNQNAFGLEGYYTPGHANAPAAWKVGKRVRVSVNSQDRWVGYIDKIVPTAGDNQDHRVSVSCVGWTAILSRTRQAPIDVQVNQNSADLFEMLLDALPDYAQPEFRQIDESQDTVPYAFDRLRDERTMAREEIYRLLSNGAGDRCWSKGDGTVVREARWRRLPLLAGADVETYSDHHGLVVESGADLVINRADLTIRPRVPGSAGSILGQIEQPIQLFNGQELRFSVPWTDPDNRTVRVGAVTTVAVVEGVDIIANEEQDGGGDDLTSLLNWTATPTGNSTEFVVTLENTVAGGWLTLARQRGTPLLDYGAMPVSAEDEDSIDDYGERSVVLALPYGADPDFARRWCEYLVFTRKGSTIYLRALRRVSSFSQPLDLAKSIVREISQRIRVVDSMTGINASFYIDSITESIGDNVVTTEWSLSPVDANSYWYVGVAGYSEVGQTTFLGPGLAYAGSPDDIIIQ